MLPVTITVHGQPETKGSARGFIVGKRVVITNDNPRAKGWQTLVAVMAGAAMRGRAMLDGPVRVEVTFTLPRPEGHAGARGLKASAPLAPAVKPDLDKLVRCALDALTGVVMVDDARVVEIVARKVYGERVGATFVIAPLVAETAQRVMEIA